MNERDLGRLDAEVKALQADMTEVKRDVKSILATLSQAQGSWKTLLAIGGLAGAIGAALMKLAMWLNSIPGVK